jgi:hypothetical protein
MTAWKRQGRRYRNSRREEREQSREYASQKSYQSSLGVGSRRRQVTETCSLDRGCTLTLRMKKTTMAVQQQAETKTYLVLNDSGDGCWALLIVVCTNR